jgi:cytidine deaminase
MSTLPAIDWTSLVAAAREVREHAYAPYSQYQVGAALLSGSGRIYAGCNVENASYGLALCAERAAIAAMISDGERTIRAIAIVTDGPVPGPPCGMCRQVLAEFADDVPVHLASAQAGSMARTTSLSKLLADPFRPHMLRGNPAGTP